jgi:predicted DNA-binding transcriptional regulator AlpA
MQPFAQSPSPTSHHHLSVQDLAARAKRSVSTIWDITNQNSGNFDPRAPKRIQITRRCTRFSSIDCDAWLRALEAGGQ